MLTDFFEPRMLPDETTAHGSMKFCIGTHLRTLYGFTEGFFEFRPRARNMGYPLGGRGGLKYGKFFFFKIFNFFDGFLLFGVCYLFKILFLMFNTIISSLKKILK